MPIAYINEAYNESNLNTIISDATVFFVHILKWIHQPERQSDSWRDSILDSSLEIHKAMLEKSTKRYNSIIIRKMNNEGLLRNCYKYALHKAYAEIHKINIPKNNPTFIFKLPKIEDGEYIYDKFNKIENIANREGLVRQWMIDHVCPPYTEENINEKK